MQLLEMIKPSQRFPQSKFVSRTVVGEVGLAGGLSLAVADSQAVPAGIGLIDSPQCEPDQTRTVVLHHNTVTAGHRSAQVRAGQVRAGQGRSCKGRSGQIRSDQVRARHGRAGQARSCQVRPGKTDIWT